MAHGEDLSLLKVLRCQGSVFYNMPVKSKLNCLRFSRFLKARDMFGISRLKHSITHVIFFYHKTKFEEKRINFETDQKDQGESFSLSQVKMGNTCTEVYAQWQFSQTSLSLQTSFQMCSSAHCTVYLAL